MHSLLSGGGQGAAPVVVSGEPKVILTALCGHGHFDMVAYEKYLSGEMTDFELPQERIDAAIASLPAVG